MGMLLSSSSRLGSAGTVASAAANAAAAAATAAAVAAAPSAAPSAAAAAELNGAGLGLLAFDWLAWGSWAAVLLRLGGRGSG